LSSNTMDAPVPAVCDHEIVPVAPAVARSALACDIEQSDPLVDMPSARSVSVAGSVATYVFGFSVSLLVTPTNRHTNEPAALVVIPAVETLPDAFDSGTGVPYGVPAASAPRYGVTALETDPVPPEIVIVLLAVLALARFHQTLSAPLVAAFWFETLAHDPAPSLSTTVGSAVPSRFVTPSSRMSPAWTLLWITSVLPVVPAAPLVAVIVPGVIAMIHRAIRIELCDFDVVLLDEVENRTDWR
jgi:hypothetical protein